MPRMAKHWTPLLDKPIVEQDLGVDRGRLSGVFSVLPISIQSRLPPLRSIRRSVSIPMMGVAFRPSSASSSGSSTPLSDADTAVVADPTRAIEARSGNIDLLPLPERLGVGPGLNIIRARVLSSSSPSRVDWKCGRQGLRLIASAVEESNSADPGYNASFERKAYIDGLSYMLKALPPDLDDAEIAILRRSMPVTLAAETGPPYQSRPMLQQTAASRSFLHRGTQAVVAQFIVLFCLVWPYVVFLLRQMAHYERKYKVSENIVGQSLEFANVVGRQSMSLSGAIYNMGDGKVGQVLTDAVAWTVQSMAGGLSEGIEEGWSKVGAMRHA